MSNPTWVPISEASARFSLHPDTIRRMISRGEIEAKRFGPKVIRVNLGSVEAAATPLALHVNRIVEGAPPLTPEQSDRIAALLSPAAGGASE